MSKDADECRERRSGTRVFPRLSLFSLLCLLFTLLALVGGCRVVVPTVKIGLVSPFEGRNRAVGYDAIYAARLALRETDATVTSGHFQVALVALDDRGDPQLAREAAASLVADPEVMLVVGHWLPETTAAAAELYDQAGLPLIILGAPPLEASDPAGLPGSFREAYAAVSPFDEVAGPYAGATYEGISLALRALEVAESEGTISRQDVATALDRLQYETDPD